MTTVLVTSKKSSIIGTHSRSSEIGMQEVQRALKLEHPLPSYPHEDWKPQTPVSPAGMEHYNEPRHAFNQDLESTKHQTTTLPSLSSLFGPGPTRVSPLQNGRQSSALPSIAWNGTAPHLPPMTPPRDVHPDAQVHRPNLSRGHLSEPQSNPNDATGLLRLTRSPPDKQLNPYQNTSSYANETISDLSVTGRASASNIRHGNGPRPLPAHGRKIGAHASLSTRDEPATQTMPKPQPDQIAGVTEKDGLGPKIWTGAYFLPRFVKQAEVAGEGLCYFYDDGSHCRTVIEGEAVNAHWGVTKAGKPRKRLAIACLTCREKKIKCDPDYPRCVQCEKFGRVCRFKNAYVCLFVCFTRMLTPCQTSRGRTPWLTRSTGQPSC